MKSPHKTIATVVGLLILVAVAIFVFTLMSGTKKETGVVIEADTITFTGQYGLSYPLADVREVRLQDSIPTIGTKVNGAGLGSIKKGDFKVEGLGVCRLFIQADSGPYLIMRIGENTVIINYPDAIKTQTLLSNLKQHFPIR